MAESNTRKRTNQQWLPPVVEIFEKIGVERTASANWCLIGVVHVSEKDQSRIPKLQRTCQRQQILLTTLEMWSVTKLRARQQMRVEI